MPSALVRTYAPARATRDGLIMHAIVHMCRYVLHFDIILTVLPHWDMFHVLSSLDLRWLFTFCLLPLMLAVSLGGTVTRLLMWPVVEPVWARLLFVGRIERFYAIYAEEVRRRRQPCARTESRASLVDQLPSPYYHSALGRAPPPPCERWQRS